MYHIFLTEVKTMKKNKLSLISLLISTTLMIACSGNNVSSNTLSSNNNNDEPTNSENSNAPVYGDSSAPISVSSNQVSSSINNNSSSQPVITTDTLDDIISQFVSDIDVYMPVVNDYDLDYSVIYYYAYEQYMIVAQCEDANEDVLNDYLAQFTADTNLVSQNDDDWYTVEDYGYLYSDTTENLSINFYVSNGSFILTISRYDGLAGTLDVSDVDTNWYVDYLNFQGMDLANEFPAADIKLLLNLAPSFVIPSLASYDLPVYAQEEFIDEDGYYYPPTFYLILEGDQVVACVNTLKTVGFVGEVIENTGSTIDWDTYEIVEYTYYYGYAYDIANNIYVSLVTDNSNNTLVTFNVLTDLFTLNKTSNADWSIDEKTLMDDTLHQILPFMQFGDDYTLLDNSDDDWTYLMLMDSYLYDLSNDYIALLLADGFEEYEDPDYGTLYRYDNGVVFIETFVYYDSGNRLEIYYEDSKLPALTSLTLNQTTLDIVAGASYQLNPIYNPSDAKHPLTWSSSNNDVATVNDSGLVLINENALEGQTATITASLLSGVSASCVFTVAQNTVTAIMFTQDSYSIRPGDTPIQTEYTVLPVGATIVGTVSYGSEGLEPSDFTVCFDGYGKLWAENDATVGKTFTITVVLNGVLVGKASVTVVPKLVSHTLDRDFFGIVKANYSKYLTYKKTTSDGATYEAYAAGNDGIQIRSKTSDSGVIGHFEGRVCESITFTFASSTEAPNAERRINIYASNSEFSITDMFGSTVEKVGSVVFDKYNLTQTYTFTSDYSYIGFRSDNGAIYLPSIEIIWK